MLLDAPSDPFGERSPRLLVKRMQLLGARFRFDSNSSELMHLVDRAYEGLPRHRLAQPAPQLSVSLRLTHVSRRQRRGEPTALNMISGSALLGGAAETANVALMSPDGRAAIVVVTPQMLRFPYHTRYELIEFAVFTLAARVQQLIPLHAACIGHQGRGLLLIGPSGSGKSTVALHCLLDGFDFLSEDSVFVRAETMSATGISNFVHIRADSLRWLAKSRHAATLRKSPIIQRRSGVRKFELDLRREGFRLAQSPLTIAGTVFLSAKSAGNGPLLRPLAQPSWLANLAATQGYGQSQPQWREFRSRLSRLGAFELRRGCHPAEAAATLRALLDAA